MLAMGYYDFEIKRCKNYIRHCEKMLRLSNEELNSINDLLVISNEWDKSVPEFNDMHNRGLKLKELCELRMANYKKEIEVSQQKIGSLKLEIMQMNNSSN